MMLQSSTRNKNDLAMEDREVCRTPTYILATNLGREGGLRGEFGHNSHMLLHTKTHVVIN